MNWGIYRFCRPYSAYRLAMAPSLNSLYAELIDDKMTLYLNNFLNKRHFSSYQADDEGGSETDLNHPLHIDRNNLI